MNFLLIGGLWLDAEVWDDTIAMIARDGHHATPVSLPATSETVLDDQLGAVVDAVDAAARPIVVVGHSAAATLAWLAADRRPSRVAGVALIGGFPTTDESAYADFFPLVDGVMPFPGWAAFEGPDSADLDDGAKAALESVAVPVPCGVAQAPVRYTDDRRFDVPVNLICPEFTPEDARNWIEAGDIPELARARHLTFTDVDTGHWPMITAPRELASALITTSTEPISR